MSYTPTDNSPPSPRYAPSTPAGSPKAELGERQAPSKKRHLRAIPAYVGILGVTNRKWYQHVRLNSSYKTALNRFERKHTPSELFGRH